MGLLCIDHIGDIIMLHYCMYARLSPSDAIYILTYLYKHTVMSHCVITVCDTCIFFLSEEEDTCTHTVQRGKQWNYVQGSELHERSHVYKGSSLMTVGLGEIISVLARNLLPNGV